MDLFNNSDPVIEIKTDRLILKVPSIEDSPVLLDSIQASHQDISPWLEWASVEINEDDCKKYLEYFSECHRSTNPNNLFFNIWSNEQKRYLGNVYFGKIDWHIPNFCIGYWLDSREHGHGYMTEAVNALSHVAFLHYKAKRLEISTSSNNIRARKIPEKLNYQLEAELKLHHINFDTKEISNTLIFSCFDIEDLPKIDLNWKSKNKPS